MSNFREYLNEGKGSKDIESLIKLFHKGKLKAYNNHDDEYDSGQVDAKLQISTLKKNGYTLATLKKLQKEIEDSWGLSYGNMKISALDYEKIGVHVWINIELT